MASKVLVTGAGGFIGSHLVEQLVRRGDQVRALVHYNSRNNWGCLEFLPEVVKSNLEVVSGDVTDPFGVRKAVEGCETVFHLAALIGIPYSYLAPQSYVNTNVLGTLNVMQACLDCKVMKVVHTSTSETYGTAIYTPIDERHPLQGQSPYSASKIGADMIAESYCRSFRLPVATIRPFNTYGPRQSARAVIPAIISQVITGQKQIKLGSLSPIRDLNFVGDTVRAFVQISESARSVGEVINVGYGKGISIGELAKTIADLMGRDVKVVSDAKRVRPENSEVFKLVCANSKAKDLAGWQPSYSLKDGLKETIAFIETHMHLYKADSYNV
jgi:NAD dependent epimerase/dehydratase